jgi:hypothetical protein
VAKNRTHFFARYRLALSTITCERLCNLLPASGSTRTRNRGAPRSSLVTGRIVIEGWSLNRSDWMTNAGLGSP